MRQLVVPKRIQPHEVANMGIEEDKDAQEARLPFNANEHCLSCPHCSKMIVVKVRSDGVPEPLGGLMPVGNRFKAIVMLAAHKYGARYEMIMSERRDRTTSNARGLAMWFFRNLTDWSFPRIGEKFEWGDGRCLDHSSVVTACQKIDTLREKDPAYRKDIDRLFMQAQAIWRSNQAT